MRKMNAILGPLMIALLLIHGIWGALQLTTIVPGGSVIRRILSYLLVSAVLLHIVIGVKLTADTLIAIKRSGASYWKGNEQFWMSRISGLALLVFIIYHMCIFIMPQGEVFRLHLFSGAELAASILLIVSLILHLAVNIKPLAIALGITNRKYVKDIVIILSILLALCAVGFIFYFAQWTILWKYGG